MGRSATITLLAALLLFGAGRGTAPAEGEVSIDAVLDKDTVFEDEPITLRVTVEAADFRGIESLKLPDSGKLLVANTHSSEQTSFTFGTGAGPVFKKIKTTVMTLVAPVPGIYTIGAAEVRYKGQLYRTEPAKVTVLKGKAPVQKQVPRPAMPGLPGMPPVSHFDDMFDPFKDFFGLPEKTAKKITNEDIFLHAVLDKSNAYVGEQVTMRVYLLTRVDISSNIQITMPKLDGFWNEDLKSPTRMREHFRDVKGVRYSEYLLKRVAIFPLKAGKLSIEPVETEVVVDYGLMLAGRRILLKSKPLVLLVKELPAQGRPEAFEAGNVGKYSLSAQIDKSELSVGEAATCRLRVSGAGNLRNLSLPKMPQVDGVKIYPPTFSDDLTAEADSLKGYRQADYLVVPQRSGQFQIPRLQFVYFETSSSSYVTLTSPAATLTVKAGGGAAAASQEDGESQVNVLAGVFRTIRIKRDLRPAGKPFHGGVIFMLLVMIPPALLAGAWSASKARHLRDRLFSPSSPRVALMQARSELKRIEKSAFEDVRRETYTEVSRVLVDYLTNRLGRQVSGMTKEELRDLLAGKNVPADVIDFLLSELESYEFERFSPGSRGSRTVRDAIENTRIILARFEKTKF